MKSQTKKGEKIMTENNKKIAERIQSNYAPQSTSQTKVEKLKELDKKVKNPARIFAYVFGSVSCLILGLGMCLAMKVIGGTTALMVVGIIIGLAGIALTSSTYPLYNKILEKRKEKYSSEILSLSQEILNDKE